MAEPKNPFDFGTGSIDKDQWQRDIDNEQDAFIARYLNATSKKRGLLLRQAFQDLRKRIANGDMLNRTADGLYQFGSALLREDADMKEAYQRALGFMGDLARRQIQAPPAEPEKKKYSSKTLNDRFIRYFNPSGSQESFTSLWNSYDDTKRKLQLQGFLRSELSNLEKNYLDVEDYDSMDNLKTRINDFLSDPSLTNLNRLGFNRNYLSLLQTEEQLEEAPKSKLDLEEEEIAQQVSDFTRRQNIENLRKLLAYALDANFSLNFPSFKLPEYSFELDLSNHTPTWGNTEQTREQYYNLSVSDLSNYFSRLATDWRSIISQQGTILNDFLYNLSKLFSKTKDGQYPYLSVIDKLFSPTNDGRFLLKDTNEENDRRVFYNPSERRFEVRGYNSLLVPSLKNGGILKFDEGGGFNFNEWDKLNNPQYYNNQKSSSNTEKVEETSKLENSPREITAADIAAISADIGSIAASFVPGYGTAASAVLGVGSTLSNFISDVNDSNTSLGDALWNGAKGLGADAIGLVPGFGAGAKGWKIATRLAKYGTSILAGLNTLDLALNSPEIMNSFKKVLSLRVGDMDLLDWRNVQNGLSMLATAGRLGHGIAVHKGYKGQLKTTGQLTLNVKPKPEPKTKLDKAKTKLASYRDKFKSPGETYDYGGPNTLPWFHDANIYLWGANRSGFSLGLKNPYKVDMSTKLLLPPKPKRKRGTNPKSKKEEPKSTLPSDRGLVWNEQTHSYVRTKEIGGVLKALRKGGIIKGLWGIPGLTIPEDRQPFFTTLINPDIQVPLDPNASTRSNLRQTINFGTATPTFFIDLDITKARLDLNRGTTLNPSRSRFSVPAAGGNTQLNYKSAMDALLAYYNNNGGKDIMGDVYNYYNTWRQTNPTGDYNTFVTDYNKHVGNIRDLHMTKFELGPDGKPKHKVNETGWEGFNQEHHLLYPSYGEYDKNKETWFGESTWRRLPNAFDDDNDRKDFRSGFLKEGDNTSYVHMKNDGTLELVLAPTLQSDPGNGAKKAAEVVDAEIGNKSTFEPQYKNPIDPTLGIIAAKTAMGLAGNRNIYKNLLDEMPQAPLRDPIDRKLAIVGWQERIKNGQNQLADLRRIQLMLQGTDLQANFATALDTERIGRDIMDKAFQEDSGRLFETAQKSWNLDNEDTLYNVGVGDANRRSIADRARMMAQIRAAWRSGDNNIKMGAISDTGNWLLKNYQREQDIVDKAKELALGTPEEWAQSEYTSRLGDLANKKASDMTEMEKARVLEVKAQVLREMRQKYSLKYLSTFGTNLFGGGTKEVLAKDGTKLEVAKLKARSKDNDRYVSMMKDLRTTRYRRRRR